MWKAQCLSIVLYKKNTKINEVFLILYCQNLVRTHPELNFVIILTEMAFSISKNALLKIDKVVSDSFVMPPEVITMLPVHVQRITTSMRTLISPRLFEILSMFQDCPSICQFIHYPYTQTKGSTEFYFACVSIRIK